MIPKHFFPAQQGFRKGSVLFEWDNLFIQSQQLILIIANLERNTVDFRNVLISPGVNNNKTPSFICPCGRMLLNIDF